MNCKKPAFWISIAAILVCIVTVLCLLTNPKAQPARRPPNASSEPPRFIDNSNIEEYKSGKGTKTSSLTLYKDEKLYSFVPNFYSSDFGIGNYEESGDTLIFGGPSSHVMYTLRREGLNMLLLSKEYNGYITEIGQTLYRVHRSCSFSEVVSDAESVDITDICLTRKADSYTLTLNLLNNTGDRVCVNGFMIEQHDGWRFSPMNDRQENKTDFTVERYSTKEATHEISDRDYLSDNRRYRFSVEFCFENAPDKTYCTSFEFCIQTATAEPPSQDMATIIDSIVFDANHDGVLDSCVITAEPDTYSSTYLYKITITEGGIFEHSTEAFRLSYPKLRFEAVGQKLMVVAEPDGPSHDLEPLRYEVVVRGITVELWAQKAE